MTFLQTCGTALAAAFILTNLAVAAAPAAERATAAELQQRYAADRAACTSGRSAQPRELCLREAAAAHAEAMRGGLGHGAQPYASNARARCAVLKGDDQAACLARMDGQGTVSGSVAGGGLYRELVTVETPAMPASAASAAR